MYLQEFPDLEWLKRTARQGFANQKDWYGNPLPQTGWPNVVLNVKTNQTYRDNILGPVSLFGNISGESYVTVGKREVLVPAGFFFISNEGQEYTLRISKPTETFNIHFGSHFIQQTIQSLTDTEIEPKQRSHTHTFRNRLIPFNESTKRLINEIKACGSNMAEQENLHAMLSSLMESEHAINKVSAELLLSKASTRDEIVRRLLVSVDLLYATSHQDLSLDSLAHVACFSKFHFLRLFKSVFGKTPHQFLMEVRIAKAKELLKAQTMDLSLIGRATGFKSAVSFSRAFAQAVGVSPSKYRQQ